jgi:succinate dehydrogenase hydrophobic anchor subunit
VAPRTRGTRGRLTAFVLVRVTGLVLAVLVLGHFALTHVITDVAAADADFVARRWASALWVAWDVTMLVCALLHGVAGMWIAVEDYTPEPARRRRRHRALTGLAVAFGLVGVATVALAIL